jgi:hypothetical protein
VSSAPQQSYIFFGRTIMLGGYVLFICGCFMYARGKGRNWYWGIFSVLGPVGLLFLYCLKDNSKMVSKKRQKELS